jgi:polyisoprenoid-binding protein YceI
MSNHADAVTRPEAGRSTPVRRRRWLRWTVVGVLTLLVVAYLGVVALVKLAPTQAPLATPVRAASPPAGALDGAWQVADGSQAGFRVRESALGVGNDVVGRTSAVTGSAVITGGQVVSATFHVDLTTITIGGKPQPQFAKTLDTAAQPTAVVTLTRPVPLGATFSAGTTTTVTAAGQLTLHGTTHPVTITLSGRRDGPTLQAAGSIPVTFSDWNVHAPSGSGVFGSLADHGIAEFLVTLRHA